MSMLSDAAVTSKCSMFLVNEDSYVELKSPANERLGLVEDQNLKASLS
jgi:hypothetical protein